MKKVCKDSYRRGAGRISLTLFIISGIIILCWVFPDIIAWIEKIAEKIGGIK